MSNLFDFIGMAVIFILIIMFIFSGLSFIGGRVYEWIFPTKSMGDFCFYIAPLLMAISILTLLAITVVYLIVIGAERIMQ